MITQCIDPRAVVPLYLPFVRLKTLEDLPTHSGIYLVISRGDIQYIGQAKNLRDRWLDGHHQFRNIFALPDLRVAYICCPEEYLPSSELLFIAHFDPPLNKMPGPESRLRTRHLLKRIGLYRGDLSVANPSDVDLEEVVQLAVQTQETPAEWQAPPAQEVVDESLTKVRRTTFKESDQLFDKFWEICAKKADKALARRCFCSALRSGVDFDTIVAALKLQQDYHLAKNGGYTYLPKPSSWLSRKRWEDDPSLYQIPEMRS